MRPTTPSKIQRFTSPSRLGVGIVIPWSLSLVNLSIGLFWPDLPAQQAPAHHLIHTVLTLNLLWPLALFWPKLSTRDIRAVLDLSIIFNIVFLLWQLIIGRTSWLAPYLFPSVSRVFYALQSDWRMLIDGLISSMRLLGLGYLSALVAGISLGLLTGWSRRLSGAVLPAAKVLSPIPPTVYVPYAIVLLPSFFAASALVVFIGAFWPLFINTVNAVRSIDSRLIDSARALCLRPVPFLLRVLLPAAAPGIFTGATLALVMSFIMLTIAEMIGAKSGLGWYIQYFADFAQYDRVVAGIVFIGLVVTAIVSILDQIQHYALRWQGENHQ